jgi:hypothetical protein
VIVGGVHAHLVRSSRLRFWRRQRPWWEYLRR